MRPTCLRFTARRMMLSLVILAAWLTFIRGSYRARLYGDTADAGEETRRRHVVGIDAMGRERGEFQEGGAWIEQQLDAFARQQLAAADMAIARLLATAPADLAQQAVEIPDQLRHGGGIGA